MRSGKTRVNNIEPSEEEGVFELRDEDIYDFKVDFDSSRDTRHYTDMTVSLIDIARPAKGKGEIATRVFFLQDCRLYLLQGVAKDFEIVSKTRKVISLDDGDFEIWEDDVFDQELWGDWEQIYDEHRVDTRPSYSSVLRGNER